MWDIWRPLYKISLPILSFFALIMQLQCFLLILNCRSEYRLKRLRTNQYWWAQRDNHSGFEKLVCSIMMKTLWYVILAIAPRKSSIYIHTYQRGWVEASVKTLSVYQKRSDHNQIQFAPQKRARNQWTHGSGSWMVPGAGHIGSDVLIRSHRLFYRLKP